MKHNILQLTSVSFQRSIFTHWHILHDTLPAVTMYRKEGVITVGGVGWLYKDREYGMYGVKAGKPAPAYAFLILVSLKAKA